MRKGILILIKAYTLVLKDKEEKMELLLYTIAIRLLNVLFLCYQIKL